MVTIFFFFNFKAFFKKVIIIIFGQPHLLGHMGDNFWGGFWATWGWPATPRPADLGVAEPPPWAMGVV
jgi:hypothetical protein